ncbi:MAG TPA: DUF5666 domain-containing protein [Sporichthya sp.]|nr:DUF5666 domain-containing protein [Sporichthya sp.]
MNGKTLVITGALTLGLLAPAGAAVAATNDDHPSPLGGVLGIFGDHDRRDHRDHKDERDARDRHVRTFKITGEIRSVDTGDREIIVGTGDHRRRVHVDGETKIWRDGDRARLRDLERGDDVRISGEKRHGHLVAERIVAHD